MTYTTDRLPKDVAMAILCGCAAAILGGSLTCFEATRQFTRQYPNDGQNGLGGLYFGLLSMPFFGFITAIAMFIVRYLRFRKDVRIAEEKAFDADLLEARDEK